MRIRRACRRRNKWAFLQANVKAIMRPTLLEFVGPLFASFPFASRTCRYRLSESDGGTLIAFTHTALGFVSEDHKAGMNKGWSVDARSRSASTPEAR